MWKGTLHGDTWHTQQLSCNHICLLDTFYFSSRFGGEGLIKVLFTSKRVWSLMIKLIQFFTLLPL